jgi:serine/threonine protein kinase
MIGSTVSHYRILEKLGEGGMGVVYKAQDVRLGRMVALKFLPPDTARVEETRQRFVAEARAAAALSHPNVAVVYDVDEADERSFIIMELLEGETLKSRIQAERMSIARAQAIAIQVAEGLQAAHDRGIVHRDIKPANLLLTRDGTVKILDFGLAKDVAGESDLTRTNMTVGTLGYMSPEQIMASGVDHRSDLWSLGVVLYEMLAQQLPFRREGEAAVLYDILNNEPEGIDRRRPDTPPALAGLVHQLLQKRPDNRPASAAEVARRLRGLADGAAAGAPPAKSIAVLYFENMSTDQEGEHICAGITEDILTDLSKVGELRVVSRTDVLPFRNKEVNIRQVAEALRVNYVLEGSVRRAGQRIRITAQLIDAREGYHLWAERFDGLVDDIFDLQNEVAQKIAGALKVSLTSSEAEALARKPTDDLRAYDLYLRGRDLLNRRGRSHTQAAIRLFESALEIDPDFTAAYAGIAEASAYMYEWYDGSPAWLTRSIDSNQAALDRDPASADARFGIAMVYFHQGRDDEARRELEGVLRADPKHVPARIRLGLLAERARDRDLDEALRQYLAAAESSPYDDEPWRHLAAVHSKRGDPDAARDAALQVIESTSRKLEASLEDVVVMTRLAEAYARFGGREETHAIVNRALESDPGDGLVIYHCACAHALLGEANAALQLLHRAHDAGFRGVLRSAQSDGAFESVMAHPEFQRMLAALG